MSTGKKASVYSTILTALNSKPSSLEGMLTQLAHKNSWERGSAGYGSAYGKRVAVAAAPGNTIWLDKRSAEALDNCKFKVVYNPIAKRYYPMVKAPGSGWASLGRKLLNLKPGDGYCVRYANGDPRDCCRSNLKKMTRAEVAYSREKGNTGDRRTSCRGVTFNACKATYQAKLYKDKKMYNLGKFDNEQDAIIARDKAALRYYGKFAKLGFMHTMKDYMVIRDKATATVAKGLSNLFK